MSRKRTAATEAKQNRVAPKLRASGQAARGLQAAQPRAGAWFDAAEVERLLAGLALNG
jgi:hypothetical protein